MVKNSGQFKPAGQEPRRGKGGRRPGAGRPTKEKLAIRDEVKRLVEVELEKYVMEVIGAGRKIATGVKRRKHNPKTGEVYYDIEYDSAMIRFWIERFVPAAKMAMDITTGTPEEFFRAIQEAKRLQEGKDE